MSDRVCLLHAGTHKTGTTSLQFFFEENRETLRAAGIYLPRSGRDDSLSGHHYLAWDLLEAGKSSHLDALVRELREADCRTALLTSEDFSLLHARPEAIQTLAAALRSAGYRPMAVLYLRPQAAYAESMYVERVKHEYIRPIRVFFDEILSTGSYRVDDSAIHLIFRYSQLLAPFAQACGRENVFARPYAPQNVAHIFKDFLSVLFTADPQFAALTPAFTARMPKANDSLTFAALLAAAYNYLHDRSAAQPKITVAELHAQVRSIEPNFPGQLLHSRFALVTRAEALRFLEAFASDNEAVANEYGVQIPFLSAADLPPEDDSVWARAQTERHIYDTLLERWMAQRSPAQ